MRKAKNAAIDPLAGAARIIKFLRLVPGGDVTWNNFLLSRWSDDDSQLRISVRADGGQISSVIDSPFYGHLFIGAGRARAAAAACGCLPRGSRIFNNMDTGYFLVMLRTHARIHSAALGPIVPWETINFANGNEHRVPNNSRASGAGHRCLSNMPRSCSELR